VRTAISAARLRSARIRPRRSRRQPRGAV
jgi:hypothetical protein